MTGAITRLALPLLGPIDATPAVEGLMCLLGEASQLVESFRDFPADLGRGKCYLPIEDMERFGVRKEDLLSRTPTNRVLKFGRRQSRNHLVRSRSRKRRDVP